MREAWIELRGGMLQQFGGKRPGICEGNDLVVFAVHYECGHIDLFKIFREVGLGEGLDAVVLGLDATHHPLPPPVFPNPL